MAKTSNEQTESLPESPAQITSPPNWYKIVYGWLRNAQSPVLAIIGGLLIGALIIALTGENPILGYSELFQGAFSRFNIPSTLNRAAPIVGAALAVSIAFRAGLINLGVEGQLVFGGLTASLVAVTLPAPDYLRLPIALLAGILAGGLYALLSAWFQFRFGVPILISSLLMNYPAIYFASYLVSGPFGEQLSGVAQSPMVPESARLASLVQGSRLNAGAFIILALVFILALVIKRSAAGYELRMRGLNINFARYGGIAVKPLGYKVMLASGMIAGVVGAIEVLGVHYRYIDTALTAPLYAWIGIMAALLSNLNPVGVLLTGLFLSALQTGGYGMERNTDIPRELALVLQAIIIMFVATRGAFRLGTED
jgi:general nucleoside transport system permease protein